METVNQSYFLPVLLASLGGGVVALGIIFEILAEKQSHINIQSMRRWTLIKKCAEWTVVGGIIFETIVGGYVAKTEWENDPQRKSIASASARVDIIFKVSKKQTDRELLGPFFVQGPNDLGWSAGINFIMGTKVILNLVAGPTDASIWNMGSDIEKECRISFKENPLNFLQAESDRNKIFVKDFNKVDSFIMFVAELPTNVVVVSGQVYLAVNDSKWQFDIPSQKPKWGAITAQKTTDALGNTKFGIKRVQVMDFVSPPRFTNVWYDGK